MDMVPYVDPGKLSKTVANRLDERTILRPSSRGNDECSRGTAERSYTTLVTMFRKSVITNIGNDRGTCWAFQGKERNFMTTLITHPDVD